MAESLRYCGRFSPCRWQTRADLCSYGKPLGHKSGTNLTGFLKIKLRGAGIRVVYKLERTEHGMTIIVIGVREDDEVYDLASKRIAKHDLR